MGWWFLKTTTIAPPFGMSGEQRGHDKALPNSLKMLKIGTSVLPLLSLYQRNHWTTLHESKGDNSAPQLLDATIFNDYFHIVNTN